LSRHPLDTAARAAQAGFGGTLLMASVSRRRERLWMGCFLRTQFLADAEVEDSPLVHTRSGVAAGIAFAWIFARSARHTTTDLDD
jgi:MipA family protein